MNAETREVRVDPQTPLLNVLRNDLGLFGPKRGCAMEQCYACSVLVDGRTQPSCQLPVGHVADMEITTVEALGDLLDFFLAEQVGQCGFCISGMMVAAQGLLNHTRFPNDSQIREALDTNICRCGVYDRVRRAIRFRLGDPEDPIWTVVLQSPLDDRASAELSPSLKKSPDLDSWLRVNTDETVTVFSGKVELGQGISTALARIAADELALGMTRIEVVTADTDITPDEGMTAGSMSVEHSGSAIRLASATARSMMLEKAAGELDSLVPDLLVADGTITDAISGRSTSYWELQGGARFDAVLDTPLPLRSDTPSIDPEADTARIDLPRKMTGEPAYVHDLRFDTMLHGRVVRPPHYAAQLESLDPSAVEVMPGVVAVVRDGGFLGVVAEREEQADAAADAMREGALWTGDADIPSRPGDLLNQPTVDYLVLDGVRVDETSADSPSVREDGRYDVEAEYSKSFTMHGSLGPSAAAARFDDGSLTVWSSSQGAFILRASIAQAMGLGEESVRVVHAEGAGCYGHNGADDVSLDAALLARAVPGRPVLTTWTRADEHRWEPYGSAMVHRLGGDIDGDRIGSLDFENWSYTHSTRPRVRNDGLSNLLAAWHIEEPLGRPMPAPMAGRHIGAHRNADPLYAIPSKRVRTHFVPSTSIRTSALRGLGAFGNVFSIESFVDEMAHRAGIDPVEFRLNSLDDERARAVVEAAAREAAWADERPVDHGRGIGFAQYKNLQTFFAVVVDVVVARETGVISIEKAVAAADSGRIVSADGLSNQLEGGIVQSASWTLKEAVQLEPEGIVSEDWETYPVLRFGESFPIRTFLLDRPDQKSLGAGEAAAGPTAAAIANAVYNAVGVRLRDIPFTPDRVLDALASLDPVPTP
ncbi:MAG: molybdopterin cofactor-binding domain-containing protein [Acidimicrobiales bacterium]